MRSCPHAAAAAEVGVEISGVLPLVGVRLSSARRPNSRAGPWSGSVVVSAADRQRDQHQVNMWLGGRVVGTVLPGFA